MSFPSWQHIADFLLGVSVVFFIRILWLEKKRARLGTELRQIIGYNRFLLKLLGESEERVRKANDRSWNVTERQ